MINARTPLLILLLLLRFCPAGPGACSAEEDVSASDGPPDVAAADLGPGEPDAWPGLEDSALDGPEDLGEDHGGLRDQGSGRELGHDGAGSSDLSRPEDLGEGEQEDARPVEPDAADTDAREAGDSFPPPRCVPGGCPAGELCDPVEGICKPAAHCSTHGDCLGDTRCVDPGLCLPEPAASCEEDARCPAGWRCDRWRGGSCLPPETCDQDQDCFQPLRCFPELGGCAQCGEGVPCPGRQRCLPGPSPLAASCADAASCVSDLDCPSERICLEGTCMPAPCPNDPFEPNDAAFQASPLVAMDYPRLLLCGADFDDWYLLTPPASAGVRVELQQDPRAPLILRLYRDEIEPHLLDQDRSAGDRALVMARGIDGELAGYLLRVSSARGIKQAYGLRLSYLPEGICPGDPRDRRPGDKAPEPLGPDPIDGLLCPASEDLFSVESPGDEELVVRLEVSEPEAPPRVMIQDPEGQILSQGARLRSGWLSRAYLPLPGLYLVLVSPDADPPPRGTAYRLSVGPGSSLERSRCELAGELVPAEPRSTSLILHDLAESYCGLPGRSEGVIRLELPDAAAVRIDHLPEIENRSAGEGARGAEGEEDARQEILLSLRGPCDDPGPELACSGEGTLFVPALPAGSYQVLVEGLDEDEIDAPPTLVLELAPREGPPGNDTCAQAELLLPSIPASGSLWGARGEGLPDPCGEAPQHGAEVYHRFLLGQAAQVHFELDSLAALGLRVLRGCQGELLSCGTREVILGPGDYIAVVNEGSDGRPASYRLTLHQSPPRHPPPHSHCEAAAALQPGLRIQADTRRADDSARPPCGGLGPDLFYSLLVPDTEPPEEQVLLLRMRAEFPASLSLRTDCESPYLGCWPVEEEVLVRAMVPAGELILGLDGRSHQDWGAFSLLASLPDRPPGDSCTEPMVLPPGAEVAGDTSAARNDGDPGAGGCTSGFPMPGPDLYFQVDLAEGQELAVSLLTRGWDGALYLLPSCELPCLEGVDDSLQDAQEQLVWEAPEAGSFLLVVDSFSGHGPYRLRRD